MRTSPSPRPDVAVVGGGIAGLAAAYRLQQAGLDVLLFEAGAYAGGKIRSERHEGYLVEHGPNTVQGHYPELEALVRELDLMRHRQAASPAARHRYVVRRGRPQALPGSPPAFLTSPLFSLSAKLRLLREPFTAPAAPDAEESVAAFVRRRLGPELLDYAVNPFVAGVYAGDPERLSVRHAFPRLHALEQDYGSLIKGQLRKARDGRRGGPAGPTGGLFSFRDGLGMLPDALAQALGPRVRLATTVRSMARSGGRWHLTVTTGDEPTEVDAGAVCFAAPLHGLHAVAFETEVDLAPLHAVPYPPLSVMALGFRREDVDHPLDGFGLLVPAREDDIQILGALFSSTLFPDRAPKDHVLLTTFVGGARHPEWTGVSTQALRAVVVRDLNRLLGTGTTPTFTRHVRWTHAIPQYELGYGRVKAVLERLEATHERLVFAGNYVQGISVGDALSSGLAAAQRLLDHG